MRLGDTVALASLAFSNDRVIRKIRVAGIPVHIEFLKGQIREYKDDTGKSVYKKRMTHHYGFIPGTRGRDGDGIDVFVGPIPEPKEIYVVHMKDKGPIRDAREDEDKVMLGFQSADAAKVAFLQAYPKEFYESMTSLPVKEFRKQLKRSQKPYTHLKLHASSERAKLSNTQTK